ncbi:MAG: septum formation protein Maf [Halobacteriovoraceae bacterium]|nr:septum formation protein Maf [Halobacteriovoraceae bacterium]|tara:strand:- start:138992 stop:139606 length:615 start_codon:yes stop_codon:yes gene_type:complete
MQKTSCQLILGSASPRRKELLERTFLPFKIITSDAPELSEKTNPAEYVEDLALLKAKDVYNKVDSHSIVLGSDTVVSSEGRILEKPKDTNHAREMLQSLSGKSHEVFTGVCLIGQGRQSLFSVKTTVNFSKIPSDLLELYLETGDSLDKAGAYGIQGMGLCFIDSIDGSYSNVVGLPLSHTLREIEKLAKEINPGIKNWRSCFE